jgi:hypothetical protein
MPTSSGTDFLVARQARLLQPDNQPRQKMLGKSLRAVVTSQEIGQMGNAGLQINEKQSVDPSHWPSGIFLIRCGVQTGFPEAAL